jgi:hypothetical protein
VLRLSDRRSVITVCGTISSSTRACGRCPVITKTTGAVELRVGAALQAQLNEPAHHGRREVSRRAGLRHRSPTPEARALAPDSPW